MAQRAIVLGAGIVGVCTALHLQSRGVQVTLVDRQQPGRATSFGNAGLIQSEAVEPYAFPVALAQLLPVVLRQDPKARYQLRYVLQAASALNLYRRCSTGARYTRIVDAYARLIGRATAEHAALIEASGASDLVNRTGWKRLYRDKRAFEAAAAAALRVSRLFGVETRILDGASLRAAEPALRRVLAGGLSYEGSWAVRDPGALVDRYCRLFERRGGAILVGDAGSLRRQAAEWRVQTAAGEIGADVTVSALGPWADRHARALGYRFPMLVKRGYHRHHQCEVMPRTPLLDAEHGAMLAPMAGGLRITTGAEFAALDAPPTPIQLAQAEARAAELVALGPHRDPGPWMGARPCSADMLPIVGPAHRHQGLWLNFGHGHQGLTLAAVTGRLLAELICGEPTMVAAQPYAPDRFPAALRNAA